MRLLNCNIQLRQSHQVLGNFHQMRKNLLSKHLFVVHIHTRRKAKRQPSIRRRGRMDRQTDTRSRQMARQRTRQLANRTNPNNHRQTSNGQRRRKTHPQSHPSHALCQSSRKTTSTICGKSMPACPPPPRSPRKSLPINHRRPNWTMARLEKSSGAKRTNSRLTHPWRLKHGAKESQPKTKEKGSTGNQDENRQRNRKGKSKNHSQKIANDLSQTNDRSKEIPTALSLRNRFALAILGGLLCPLIWLFI